MDNLEDFIRKNKASFDSETPSEGVWKNIKAARKSAPKPTKQIWMFPAKIMRIAASIAILCLAAFGTYKLISKETPATVSAERNLPNNLAELDQYYEQQVGMYMAEVEKVITDTTILNSIKQDLKLLDKEKSSLFDEYGNQIADEQIVQALISTYRMKIQVLEDILTLMNENNDQPDKKI